MRCEDNLIFLMGKDGIWPKENLFQSRPLGYICPCYFFMIIINRCHRYTPPPPHEDARGFKSRIRPPYPQRVVKGD